jgi:hypothetical protein
VQELRATVGLAAGVPVTTGVAVTRTITAGMTIAITSGPLSCRPRLS